MTEEYNIPYVEKPEVSPWTATTINRWGRAGSSESVPTDFPDCNHGMAMLGLLELMAAQNATVDEMFTAAKYVNAFWYP